ncbi:Protein SYS1-like protein [Mucuna pruriens]|uniref:Protein SYS1-like protein n=1 Tax=Mucuna pruriens TaxID=157652 RepID=A0A371FLU8_MUCPR|nr:Protein SYS1-like protein [Mucuna pruriens]
MFYGAVVWDPWLIVAQIVCLQCLYYITLGLFLSILVGTRVSRMSLVYFFDYVAVTTTTVTGWCVIASFLLSSVAGAVYMLYLIERFKKCWDFSATLYIIHLFICVVYGGWPSSITWWILNGSGIAVMALLGEHLCRKRELQEIPVSRRRELQEIPLTRYRSSKNFLLESLMDILPLKLTCNFSGDFCPSTICLEAVDASHLSQDPSQY